MKTSDFIKYFKDEGLEVVLDVYSIDGLSVLNLKNDYEPLFDISENNSVDTDYIAFNNLPFDKQQEYYKVIFEYLMTPLKEREEKKEYYLKLKHFNSLHNYLNLNINSGEYELSTIESTQQFKTKFTEKEIDDIPKGIKSHNWEYVEVI